MFFVHQFQTNRETYLSIRVCLRRSCTNISHTKVKIINHMTSVGLIVQKLWKRNIFEMMKEQISIKVFFTKYVKKTIWVYLALKFIVERSSLSFYLHCESERSFVFNTWYWTEILIFWLTIFAKMVIWFK